MVDEIRLPNGMTLVAESAPSQHGVSLGLFVRGAVVDEPETQPGIAHLLEHLVFRGTARYSGAQLSAAIEEDGGEFNAYTTKEYTCLWGRTLPEGLSRYVELLAELFERPLLRPRDISREVQIIAEEHALWQQSPEELCCDLLEEEIFAPGLLSRRVLGSPEVLPTLRAQDLRAFHEAAWRPERAVIAVAGPLATVDVMRILNGAFHGSRAWPPARRRRSTPATQPLRAPDMGQVHLAVGGPGLALGDERLPALELLVQEFGGGPNSRLFQRLREEDALSYSIYSYVTSYASGGMWGVYADLPPGGMRQGIEAIVEEARRLRAGRLGERRLEQMRRAARGALLLSLDGPFARVERHALQLLLRGRTDSVEDELERLAAVDVPALRAAAQQVLDPKGWRAVVLLPGGRLLRGGALELLQAEVSA